jgi:hypothetical protein
MRIRRLQSGFAIIEVLVVILILTGIGFTSWYVWHYRQTTDQPAAVTATLPLEANTDTYKTGIITFRHASQFSPSLRSEIMTKIVNPFIYYNTKDVESGLTGVVIDLGLAPDNTTRSAKYGYIFNDLYPGSNNQGFIFGEEGAIDYWIPPLCDDGGCKPYPQDFKAKFPATYQAYVAVQKVTK